MVSPLQLPYLEDIYDFGETELNDWFEKIDKAVKLYEEGNEDKWYYKAVRARDLIEIELDERVSIGQITSFCLEEFNSTLYNEIQSEDSQSDARSDAPTETTAASEEQPSVAESMWKKRGKMGAK